MQKKYRFTSTAYLLILVILASLPTTPYANTVTEIRTNNNSTQKEVRLVIETTKKPEFSTFTLQNPERLVIDIKQGEWKLKSTLQKELPIRKVRHGKHDTEMRIVFDLIEPIKHIKHFILPPSPPHQYRLVFDVQLGKPNSPIPATPNTNETETLDTLLKSLEAPPPIPVLKFPSTPAQKTTIRKKPLIIIDAGHGGKDPGALGRNHTKEKHITLKYAKALKQKLEQTGRYNAKLTRSTDKYIKLRNRVKIAQKAGGDLFISLHADSHRNPKTRGLSVYSLSEKASDKEAAALARRANRGNIIEGVNLKNQKDDIVDVLIDLVQRDTKNSSAAFAEIITRELGKEVNLLRRAHRFAGFRVLTAADIPSVLIELGYLSNRKEEALLNSANYRNKIISALVRSIDRYFE